MRRHVKITSFRYTEDVQHPQVLDWFRGLAGNYADAQLKQETRSEGGWSPADLNGAAAAIFSPSEYQDLRQSGRLCLSPEKLQVLQVPRVVSVHSFASRAGMLACELAFLQANSFPCLGPPIWLSDDLVLPGGFLRVEAQNPQDAESVLTQFRHRLGIGESAGCGCRIRDGEQ
jgi:hypothetical protein